MEKSLLIAGFGGQGVMLIGQLLGYSATAAGKYATYYPSYGAEQRGGTANCTVVIGDEEIGSPVVAKLDTIIVMNEPSLSRFEGWIKLGGTIFVNSSLVTSKVSRTDVKVLNVPMNEMALELGSDKVANMIMLGAFVGETNVLPVEKVIETMKEKLDGKPRFLPINESAILAGVSLAKESCRIG